MEQFPPGPAPLWSVLVVGAGLDESLRGTLGWLMESWLFEGLYGGVLEPWRLGRGAVNPCVSQLWAQPWGLTKVSGWSLLSMASHHQFLQVSFSSMLEVNLTYEYIKHERQLLQTHWLKKSIKSPTS